MRGSVVIMLGFVIAVAISALLIDGTQKVLFWETEATGRDPRLAQMFRDGKLSSQPLVVRSRNDVVYRSFTD
jgi:hypothetical protein